MVKIYGSEIARNVRMDYFRFLFRGVKQGSGA